MIMLICMSLIILKMKIMKMKILMKITKCLKENVQNLDIEGVNRFCNDHFEIVLEIILTHQAMNVLLFHLQEHATTAKLNYFHTNLIYYAVKQVLAILQRILDTHNVFVHILRQISAMPNINDVRLHLKDRRPDQHQYNLPTASQVAAILIGGDDPYDMNERDIIVQTKSGHLLNVPDTAGFYDPLQYPLLHPYGEFGWDIHLYNRFANKISCRAYYCFLLQIRHNQESLILRSGQLLQQYAVDTYVKISTQQLRYIRDHQQKIRAELYQGLQDSVANGETHACNIGRRVILPATFIGSPRDMHERLSKIFIHVTT